MSESAMLPAGTTVYYCPLCGWAYEELPPTEREVAESASDPVVTVLRRRLASSEAAIEAHLGTHGLVDWLTAVNGLRSELDVARSELERVTAEKERGERDAVLVTTALVRKLGSRVLVSDADLVAEDGTLVRIPEMHGFTLALYMGREAAS